MGIKGTCCCRCVHRASIAATRSVAEAKDANRLLVVSLDQPP